MTRVHDPANFLPDPPDIEPQSSIHALSSGNMVSNRSELFQNTQRKAGNIFERLRICTSLRGHFHAE
jgi:hypothetical protein